jgi:uncharacterized protein
MILVKPTIECNARCRYCYENGFRSTGDIVKYDPEKVKRVINESRDHDMSLHGGEPLFIGKAAVKDLLDLIYKKTGKSGIQTNGILVDDEYVEMFKAYKTNVGISIDGPGNLNRFRYDGETTSKVISTISKLRNAGVPVSVIMVLSKANGLKDELPILQNFIAYLSDMGITGRINPCISGVVGVDLDESQLVVAYDELLRFVLERGYSWSPFYDMWNSLQCSSQVVCTFKGCDIFNTPSCEVVLGDGTVTNCMRVSQKDLFYRANNRMNVRDQILSQVGQDNWGCKGCEYWYACHGGCPTHAVNDDWRNRTRLCMLYKHLFFVISGYQKAFKVQGKTPAGSDKCVQYDVDHSDGVEHIDNYTRHLDSGKGE